MCFLCCGALRSGRCCGSGCLEHAWRGQPVVFATYVRHSLHTQAKYVTSVTASATQGTRPRAPLREPHHTSWVQHAKSFNMRSTHVTVTFTFATRVTPAAASSTQGTRPRAPLREPHHTSWATRGRHSRQGRIRRWWLHHIELHHLGLHHLAFGLGLALWTESVIHPLAYTVT